jgi:hypothetical protein
VLNRVYRTYLILYSTWPLWVLRIFTAYKRFFVRGLIMVMVCVKLLVNGFDVIRIPSYISRSYWDVPGRVVFNGNGYTVGESAWSTGYYFERNTDSNINKVNDALITLLGALAHSTPCKLLTLFPKRWFNCKSVSGEDIREQPPLPIAPELLTAKSVDRKYY